MVPSSDATEVFSIMVDNMSSYKKMPELLAYLEHTYIRDRRRPGLIVLIAAMAVFLPV